MTYEAYGLGGVGVVVEILTDNLNRAAMTVRTAVTKSGGKMADPGSVLFNFERRGFCVLTGGDEEAVFGVATDAGADDVTPRPGGAPGWEVVTPVAAYGAVEAAGYSRARADAAVAACALLGVAPGRSVAVGDSVNDALSARAAGCAVLAVPYGYNHGNSVQTLDVDAIVENIQAAARWILGDGKQANQSH